MKLELTREALWANYADCLAQNPLLGRMEGELRTVQWTEEEVRTAQLLVACASNASLMARVQELERRVAVVVRD